MSKRIAYLAPYNSSSAEVAKALGKRGYRFLECVAPFDLINSIDDDTYGVLPLEDCVDALASESIDALIKTDLQVFISKKHYHIADYRIFVLKGVEYRDILKVRTPINVYEMCRVNINEIMPQAKIELVSSIDRAIEELNETTCAIASVVNNTKHLSMGSATITDMSAKPIAFGYITNEFIVAKDASTTLLSITAPNIKGSIASIADVFDKYDIAINHFKTTSIIDGSINIIVEASINARTKDLRDAINEIEGEIIASIDDDNNNIVNGSKVKILGSF